MKNLLSILFLALVLGACTSKKEEGESSGAVVDSAEKFIRKNAHSEEAKADLEAMEKAFEIMREAGCTEPISWYYQGAIHNVPLETTTPKPHTPNPLCESFQFNASQLKTAWANCTHGGTNDFTRKAINYNFLIWHRLYIWYFEQIVRELSGKEDFALPYWAYTNTENAELNRTIPMPFRNPSSSLFEKARFKDVNDGKAISDSETLEALDLTKLMKMMDFYEFASRINRVPHGTMHDYVGAGYENKPTAMYFNSIYNKEMTSGLMGEVPSAGFDPIFWLHHANIDRIWQQWTNSENGKEVCLDTLKKYAWPKYTFFDGKGKQVDYTIEDVYKIIYNGMDYTYDDTEVKGRKSMTECKPMLKSQQGGSETLASSTKSFVVGNTKMDVVIPNSIFGKKTLLKSQGGQQKVVLSFEIEFPDNEIPRGTYQLYLNAANGKDRTPSDPSFCGFINFFETRHHQGHGEHHEGHSEPFTELIEMEISKEISEMNALANKNFTISIEGFDDEKLIIKNVKIIKL